MALSALAEVWMPNLHPICTLVLNGPFLGSHRLGRERGDASAA